MSFIVYPALDIRDDRVVRLRQGDYAQETSYGDDPLPRAQAFAAQGAQWMHLVDLDAARAGGYTLAPLLAAIRAQTPLQVQTGGGVRGRDDVARMLDAGAGRVVVGSLAVRRPDEVVGWLEEFGAERITIALDARQDAQGQWQLPVHGWTENAGVTLDDLAQRYARAGMRHLLCTDIARDGMLAGPNIGLYQHLSALLPGWRCRRPAASVTWPMWPRRVPLAAVVRFSARHCWSSAWTWRRRWHVEPPHHSLP